MTKMALMALSAALTAGTVATANAQVSTSGISFTPGVYGVTNSTAKIFETFDNAGTAPNNGVAFGTGAGVGSGTYSETTTGSDIVFPGSHNVVGSGENPQPGQGDNYLAVGGDGTPGTFTVSFGGAAEQYFSFAFGSLDSYNSVTLNFAGGVASETFTGLGIIEGMAFNTTTGTAPTSYGETGRVAFNAQGNQGITSVTFGSSQAAFEIDDLAAAAPEPAAWALMILGFGLVGGALRLRRRESGAAFA